MADFTAIIQDLLQCQREQATPTWAEDKAEELLAEIGSPLLDYLHRKCRDPQKAEDLFQETLLAIFKNLGQFRGKTNKEFWGWCYRIAFNKVVKPPTRKNSMELIGFDPAELNELADARIEPANTGANVDHEYARELLNQTKEPCRQFLHAYYILEMDYESIAATVSMEIDAVRMRIRRCLEAVRKLALQTR